MITKTAIGATAAAATLALVGVAGPAMASDGDYTSISKWSSRSDTSHSTTNTVIAPQISVGNGDLLNGNSVGSGNDVTAPLLSGNDTALGNGNDTAIGTVSGNSVSTEVSDLVDNATHTSVSDIVDISDVIGDISGWVDLKGIFED